MQELSLYYLNQKFNELPDKYMLLSGGTINGPVNFEDEININNKAYLSDDILIENENEIINKKYVDNLIDALNIQQYVKINSENIQEITSNIQLNGNLTISKEYDFNCYASGFFKNDIQVDGEAQINYLSTDRIYYSNKNGLNLECYDTTFDINVVKKDNKEDILSTLQINAQDIYINNKSLDKCNIFFVNNSLKGLKANNETSNWEIDNNGNAKFNEIQINKIVPAIINPNEEEKKCKLKILTSKDIASSDIIIGSDSSYESKIHILGTLCGYVYDNPYGDKDPDFNDADWIIDSSETKGSSYINIPTVNTNQVNTNNLILGKQTVAEGNIIKPINITGIYSGNSSIVNNNFSNGSIYMQYE